MKEIHEKGDSKVDNELASKLGFENLDALRDAVAGQLASQHATALRAAVKTNVFDQLADQMDFDVPPSLLQSEYDVVVKSIAEPHDHNHNDDNDHTQAADEGLNDEQKEEARTVATRRVRLGLLLTEDRSKQQHPGQRRGYQTYCDRTIQSFSGAGAGSFNIIKTILMLCSNLLGRCLKSL